MLRCFSPLHLSAFTKIPLSQLLNLSGTLWYGERLVRWIYASLLPKLPYDVMICYLYQSPTLHERYENGKKQAISRHYTKKQTLTPNYLHLCIRKKEEGIKGKEKRRSQEIKTRREKKKRNKHHSQVEDEACIFHQRIKVKDRILISTWGREGMSFGELTNAMPMQ